MFDEWGGTKRELSIYSILTIIVLISISGGCAGFEGQESSSKFPTKLCNDAGLILKDDEYGKGQACNWTNIQQPRMQYIGYTTRFFKVDGQLLTTDNGQIVEVTDAIRISPGEHTIEYRTWKIGESHVCDQAIFESRPTSILVVEPHAVYVLHTKVSRTVPWSGSGSYDHNAQFHATYEIIKTKYTYEEETGIAHHPTDSKRSFKVK